MQEIEQKFRDADFAAIERHLRNSGAAKGAEQDEADHYLNAPDRDFAQTDEAFRLHRIGTANFLTYKGPKQAGDVKKRTELEIALPDGPEAAEQFLQLFRCLGYRPVAMVRKRRRHYHCKRDGFDVTICLDDVEGLGRFAEVEVLAPNEKEEAAEAVIQSTAKALNLTAVERRSYLEMVLAAQRRAEMSMLVTAEIELIRQAVAAARRQGKTIGLVPTMGTLHAGHLSLVKLARSRTGFVVVSIFINPTQFGPKEDFGRYPRPRERDLELCERAGVDLVFAPEPKTMYPPGCRTFVEVAELQDGLCGATRPGHFRGVATVVLKLFNIVTPDVAWFGQKDAQQVRIIQQMARDLDASVEIAVGPTVREPDGLALSSRDEYLDPIQRRQAPGLYRALREVAGRIGAGERDAGLLRRLLVERLAAIPGAVLDYAEVVAAESLQTSDRITGPTLLAVAVKFGGTRLIDNILVSAED